MHSNRAHALLSASSAERWLNCTPSAVLEEKQENYESEFAQEGTTAHEYAELLIQNYLGAERPYVIQDGFNRIRNSKWYDQLFEDYVQEYVQFVLNLMTTAKNYDPYAMCLTEAVVDYSNYVPEGFGTCDSVIIYGRCAYVTDLKFGKGVAVSAVDNPQLMLYALGVYQTFGMYVDIDKFKLCIYQPRLNNVSNFDITLHELLSWAESYVVPRAKLAFKGEGETEMGNWCRFCKLKGKCARIRDEYITLRHMAQKPVTILSEEEEDQLIQYVLKTSNVMKNWISSIEKLALKKAINGNPPKGYKVVRGKSNRKIINPNAIANILINSGFQPSEVYQSTLKPLGSIEKLVGKTLFRETFSEYVEKPEGAATLVPSSDNRNGISNADYFQKIDD